MNPTLWDIDPLLPVVHVLGVDLLAARGKVGDFERVALAILGELDFAVAHRLVALHVSQQ